MTPRVTVFGPNPLLTVTVEPFGAGGDDIHLHAGGQGVWVARMAAELGATPILCGFAGGETGLVLSSLLRRIALERRLVSTASPSGSYVIDCRNGSRALVGQRLSAPPSRHELDDLLATTRAALLDSEVLVICNPYPGDIIPLAVFADLVQEARTIGLPVLVDLSTPRLASALEGSPDLVKVNDWELAEFVQGPVGSPGELRAATEKLAAHGAQIVVVTRGGDPAFVLADGEAWELVPPRFGHGHREGCGDSMMGAIAAAWANRLPWQDALMHGAAAGAANYLRHGLGTGSRQLVAELRERVAFRRVEAATDRPTRLAPSR